MAKTTFWNIIISTLEKEQKPLSPKEIWKKANDYKLLSDFTTTGKTPWATIGAYCYTDIQRAGESSTIIQTNERPAEFYLRKHIEKLDLDKISKEKDKEEIKNEKEIAKKYKERDLHCLLSAFTFTNQHFKANTKTIFHENSSKGTKGQNEWLHPDIVGVYFPYQDYKHETLEIQNHLNISSIKLFSFELKINLNFTNLRQYYFQAVSNSSWANEGYLVILNIDDDPALLDEIRRLNNAFGIGIVKLNAENVYESEILFPSKINEIIDWDTVNRLVVENKNFSDFLKSITEDCKLGKIKSEYDKILDIDELTKFIIDKGIS
ncbi:HTH domain-containing protein [Flavobacterium piscisymbiosum]|uniref:HTH HARE-type domain-containing protein n=1 Tax=Flavobacterium piscisymbiosum TaxID=2893753 RepID=A0ABS8MDR3_9FLAO|nr:HTH domain-containing protein [Flavobacterium sp. F-30]MCC9063640.1 hypothetical protein [Flavobacterium sp. F-30]